MTLLSHYYQPDTDPAVIRMVAEDWWDILGAFPQEAVAEACREYLREEPRARPTPGAIRQFALKHVKREIDAGRLALPAPPQPPPRERVTPERAAEILREYGMSPERLGYAPKSMPKVGENAA